MRVQIMFWVLLGSLVTLGQDKDDAFETKVYNVEFLTRPFQDQPGPELSSLEEDVVLVGAPAEESAPFDGETLVELIRNNIDEDSWEHEGASLEYSNGILTVTNRKSVHRRISSYLDYWRSRARRIVVDAAVIAVDPGLWSKTRGASPADRPASLTAEQAGRLMEAARAGREAALVCDLRLTAIPGQRVHVKSVDRRSYLRDFSVSGSAMTTLLDPRVDELATGFVLDVRAILEPFADAVTLEVRFDGSELEKMEEINFKLKEREGLDEKRTKSEETECRLQLPRLAVDKVRTTLTVRDRETAVVAAWLKKGRVHALLMTPTVTALSEKPLPEPAFEEKRLLRLYDISLLTRPLTDFPGWRLDRMGSDTAGDSGVTFTLEERIGARLDAETVIKLIKSRVAPDSWGNKRNRISHIGDYLAIRQTPEVLKEIDRYLGELLTARAQMITAEAVLLGFKKNARAELAKQVPGLGAGGYFIEPAQMDKLLEAARGTDVRVVERSEITSFPQARAHVARLLVERYLAGYDVVAVGFSAAHDPNVRSLLTGFVFDQRSFLDAEGERVTVELRSSLAWRGSGALEAQKPTSKLGPVQLARTATTAWLADVVCRKDAFVLVSANSFGTGDEFEEMLLFVRARPNSR